MRATLLYQVIILFVATTTTISAPSNVLGLDDGRCEYGKILSICVRDFGISNTTSITSTTTSRTTTTTSISTSATPSTTATTLSATSTTASENFEDYYVYERVLGPTAAKCEYGMIWSTFINKCVEDFNIF